MKKETTMKYITNVYRNVYRCGYCDLQNIFHGIEPTYYNAGIYGWNCDIYDTPAGAITTGYRNMRGDRIPLELIEKYDAAAREILRDMWTDPDYRTRLENLRKDFLGDLMNL